MVENGKIPPTKNGESLITDPISKKVLEAANGASSTQLWWDQYLAPEVAQVHLDTCQELFGLTITPEEADAQLQAAIEEYNADKEAE